MTQQQHDKIEAALNELARLQFATTFPIQERPSVVEARRALRGAMAEQSPKPGETAGSVSR